MGSVILMVVILTGLVILMFVLLGAYQVTVKKQESVKDRLDAYVASHDQAVQMPGQKGLDAAAGAAALARKTDFWENFGSIFTPDRLQKNIALKLAAAGIPLRANEFMAIVFFASFAPLVVGFLILKNFVMGIGLALLGAAGPFVWVSMKRAARCKLFAAQLLDTLLIMSNALKAGYSFLQTIELLTREAPSPTCDEFKRVVRENSLGADVEKSLEQMARRVESEDFDLLVTVISINKEVGGNLAEILESIADTIRDRQKIKGQIKALTAQGRAGGYVIALLPIGLFIMMSLIRKDVFIDSFLLGEWVKTVDGVTYGTGFKGWYMFVMGGILEMIGFFVIMKIVDIEV